MAHDRKTQGKGLGWNGAKNLYPGKTGLFNQIGTG